MSVSSRRRAHFHILHPIVTFRRLKLEKCQNWSLNGAPNQIKCHQNAIQNTCSFHSCFWFVFDQKWTPKWSPKWPWTRLFFTHFSNVVPDLALGPTSVHFWVILGAPRLHFGLILALFGGPQSFNFGTHGLPTAYVLEFVDNLFLEQITSHIDSGTWYSRPMF